MGLSYSYSLKFINKEVFLFKSDVKFDTEEQFFEFLPTGDTTTLHRIEDVLKALKYKARSGNGFAGTCIENCKTGLAHQLKLIRTADDEREVLKETFFPVWYKIKKASDSKLVELGLFYRKATTDVDDQFPIFAETFSYPDGQIKWMVGLCIRDGDSLLGFDNNGSTLLLEQFGAETGRVVGRKKTIQYMGFQFIEAQ